MADNATADTPTGAGQKDGGKRLGSSKKEKKS